MRVGLLASTGKHLDSFFPDIRTKMEASGLAVYAAAGTPTERLLSENIHGMTQGPTLRSTTAPRHLRHWVEGKRLDVILTNTATASALARIADVGIPVVYFCHGLHWNTGRRPMERVWIAVEKYLLPRTTAVITINADDREWFTTQAPNLPHLHLPSGVGLPSEFLQSPRTQVTDNELRLVWIGDFSRRKQPEVAVEVARHLRDKGHPFHLNLLGDGPLWGGVAALVQKYGLADQVSLTGRVTSSMDYIDRSHAIIHTSKWEGLPRVLLEGLARGRRAVAFDVKGVRDIPNAILVPPSDPQRMALSLLNSDTDGILRTITKPPPTVETSYRVGGRISEFLMSGFSSHASKGAA